MLNILVESINFITSKMVPTHSICQRCTQIDDVNVTIFTREKQKLGAGRDSVGNLATDHTVECASIGHRNYVQLVLFIELALQIENQI